MNLKKFKVVLMLAKRDILDDRKVSIIVIAALSFSFLNLAFFPAFISGFSGSFIENIVETQTGHVQISAEDGRIEDAGSLVATVENLPEVENVEKQLQTEATLSTGSDTISSPLIGVESRNLDIYKSRMQSGSFVNSQSEDDLVLGVFRKESETVGDRGLETQIGENVEVSAGENSRSFSIIGVVGNQGPGGANANVYISYKDAEEFLDVEGEATKIKILLNERNQAEGVKNRLKELNVQGEIKTWNEASEIGNAIDATFGIVTAVVSLVGLIVAVTSIGVVIFINVNKRMREIGILRSIGLPKAMVLSVFVLEALIFGFMGVLIGNGLMLSIDAYLNANPIDTPLGALSTNIEDGMLLTRSIWLMCSAFVAGVIPAWFASRKDIVEAIENR